MKKALFATTALVLSAGVAAAEVTVGGDGRMGVIYDGTDWNFTSRIRISFTASGETDGGLSFGGSVRADHYNTDLADGDTSSGTNGASGSVYISGAFGKITMGDVDSAAHNAVGHISGVGLTGLGDYNENLFITSGMESANDPHLLYEYSAGDLSFYASLSDGVGNFAGLGYYLTPTPLAVEQGYSAGVSYTMGDYKFGLGYESLDLGLASNMEQIILGGSATFGAVTVKASYGMINNAPFIPGDVDQYGVSVDYTFGATTVTGFYQVVDPSLAAFTSAESMGIGASYDLGGGASLKGGIVDSDFEAETIADFGVAFTF